MFSGTDANDTQINSQDNLVIVNGILLHWKRLTSPQPDVQLHHWNSKGHHGRTGQIYCGSTNRR
jgi:hypothetical protein